MTSDQIHHILRSLAIRRPCFHSEADFQHELALAISRDGYEVRLEVPRHVYINGAKIRVEIDLVVRGEKNTAIELKYVKRRSKLTHNNEQFELAETWGTNLSRFDCIADYRRIECYIDSGYAQNGHSIFLTNARSAWITDASKRENFANSFSIHEGRKIPQKANLDWTTPQPTAKSVSSKRLAPYAPIVLRNPQVCTWRDYSSSPSRNGVFRYLMLSC